MAGIAVENLRKWSRVHKGNSLMKPLLGSYEVIRPAFKKHKDPCLLDVTFIQPRNLFSERVCSLRVPSHCPGDIEYLKSKLGFCLPSEEQVIRSQYLKLGALRSHYHSKRMASMGPNADGASLYSTSTSIRNRFKRLVQGKTPSQLEKERALQKSKDRRKLLKELESTCKNDRTDFTHLENYLNTKLAHKGQVAQRIVASFDYSHTERRNLEIEKIAKRARRMSLTRNKRIEDHVTKHSLYDDSLRRAVIESLESKKIKKKSQTHRRPSDIYGPARDGNSASLSPRESWQRLSLVHERISSRSTPYTVSGSRRGSDDEDEEIFLQLRRGSLSPPVSGRRGTLPSVATGSRGTLSAVPEKRGI